MPKLLATDPRIAAAAVLTVGGIVLIGMACGYEMDFDAFGIEVHLNKRMNILPEGEHDQKSQL